MSTNKTDIYVYAHWKEMSEPKIIGILSAQQAKSKKTFSFKYDNEWLKSEQKFILDPDIQLYGGPQYPNQKENFGIFLDSMPDTWGRTLMKRREAQLARENNEKPKTLYDIDFLLGVYDESRMGALRFKTNPEGDFLDNNKTASTPPWSSIRELQNAAANFENDDDNDEVKKWLSVLMAPGSSLGGARPKANVLDADKSLWIAKFPSKTDTTDKAAWEFLAYQLAISPAYDLNPSIDKDGLTLNIDTDNNDLDFELAKSVGEYFRLNKQQMETIIQEVLKVTSNWRTIAKEIKIPRSEQELMEKAFHV